MQFDSAVTQRGDDFFGEAPCRFCVAGLVRTRNEDDDASKRGRERRHDSPRSALSEDETVLAEVLRGWRIARDGPSMRIIERGSGNARFIARVGMFHFLYARGRVLHAHSPRDRKGVYSRVKFPDRCPLYCLC